MIYANVERFYSLGCNKAPSLFDTTETAQYLTINRAFTCGGPNGTWEDAPFKEVQQSHKAIPPVVRDLARGGQARTLAWREAVPTLFETVKAVIAAAWRPDAFHLVFHSSGYDSRIISAAIQQLLGENGPEWLGKGLLFLSNRWEAANFRAIMRAAGWEEQYYAAYDEGPDDEHFALGLEDIWQFAPLPIPGNLWHYLPKWARSKGLLPDSGIQSFCGLWANEAWGAFLSVPNPWVGFAETWYGWNCMAALPIDAEWQEFPLVATGVLDVLTRIVPSSGNEMRKAVAEYGMPEARQFPNPGLDDRKHPLSDRLRRELDERYRATAFGQVVQWIPPTNSEFSTEWGRYSTAILVERLCEGGIDVKV